MSDSHDLHDLAVGHQFGRVFVERVGLAVGLAGLRGCVASQGDAERAAAARLTNVGRSLHRIAVPTAVCIGAVILVGGPYALPNLLLLNHLLRPQEWGLRWNFLFLEALVLLVVGVVALVTLRPVDRWQRRRPFAFAVLFVLAGLLVRFELLPVDTGPGERFTTQALLWVFVLVHLAAVDDLRLADLVLDAWRARASGRLLRERDNE